MFPIRSAWESMRIFDVGTQAKDSVDYNDFAEAVAQNVINGQADFGILMCSSGIGMSIMANRHPEIRAALVTNPADAAVTRQHNNANILCFGARNVTPADAPKLVEAFLTAKFEGGRHVRRVEKLTCGTGSGPIPLRAADPEVFAAIEEEKKRQFENIELIASENFTSRAVMEAQGSCLTNKYAEGYPGRRWYGGCENVDVIEQLAIDRVKQLFGAEYANVQPNSGSQANQGVFLGLLQPGETIMGMSLAEGGHLTHGMALNMSGKWFRVVSYGLNAREQIDYDAMERRAYEYKPKLIIAGASAYALHIDFARFAAVAKAVGAYLMVDMAHYAGLIAAGVYPNPVPFAD